MYHLSTPRAEIELTFSLQTAVSEIPADFQNCHIVHEAWNLKKAPDVAYVPFPTPPGGGGVEIKLISLYGQRFHR